MAGAGAVTAVAIEATTGWRWVWRELSGLGFDVPLAEPVQARALLGRRRSAKTDRLDALAGASAGEGDAAGVVDPAVRTLPDGTSAVAPSWRPPRNAAADPGAAHE